MVPLPSCQGKVRLSVQPQSPALWCPIHRSGGRLRSPESRAPEARGGVKDPSHPRELGRETGAHSELYSPRWSLEISGRRVGGPRGARDCGWGRAPARRTPAALGGAPNQSKGRPGSCRTANRLSRQLRGRARPFRRKWRYHSCSGGWGRAEMEESGRGGWLRPGGQGVPGKLWQKLRLRSWKGGSCLCGELAQRRGLGFWGGGSELS